jgi:hypothetical protein
MTDLIRPLRGAFPGEALEPDADIRAQLALLGAVGVRYGGMGEATAETFRLLDEDSNYLTDENGNRLSSESA